MVEITKDFLLTHHYIKNKSVLQISKELDIPNNVLRRLFKSYGIEIRWYHRNTRELANEITDKLKDKEWLIEQYCNKNKSINTIAKELGISKTPINKAFDKLGIKRRTLHQHRISDDVLQKLNDKEWLYDQHYNLGKSLRQIKDELDIHYDTIRSYFKKYGINIRDLTLNFDFVKNRVKKEGYKVLSTSYINANTKLIIECPKNHVYEVTYSNWDRGRRCPTCFVNNRGKNKLLSELYVKTSIEKEGYSLLSLYTGAHNDITLKCPKGHIYKTKWNNWQQGNRCCEYSNRSRPEIEIGNWLILFNFNLSTNYKGLIPPYELDIIIIDKKIAIEYCGLYWHSELQGKDRNYHLNKLQLCNEKNYRLITIFEDEWINYKDIIYSRLSTILNISNEDVIYARNCCIKEIIVKDSINFLSTHHIQGAGKSSIKLGAFYNEELVAVMTFSRPSIAKGARNQDFWEINRFCSHSQYRIHGVASKLLKHFERNYEWNKIISYADRRWSEGNLYYKLGFDLVGETQPNYWYIDKRHNKRIHRFSLRKKPEEPKNKTEWELRQEQGYDRIWDCGSLKFEKFKNK